MPPSRLENPTYCIDILEHRHFKQQTRRARSPTFVFLAKFQPGQVTNDTSHGYFAVSPCSTKVEAEDVVFHILLAMYIDLGVVSDRTFVRLS